jgi:cell division protein FtsX
VIDLDTQLERLAAEATRDAVPPEPAALARRGRRRRRRQLAGSALVVAAVVAAGLILPARLTGRPGDGGPVAEPATDVSGAGMLTGHWFGKADASVFLSDGVDPARRAVIRRQLEALDVVDEVWFESRREAYDRFRALHRAEPEPLERTRPAALPESFRVRLRDPGQFKPLYQALCRPGDAEGKPRCVEGVDSVVDEQVVLKPLLVGKRWMVASDVTILLAAGTTAAERAAIRARLAAIEGVARVDYESPAAAFRRLPEKLREGRLLAPKVTPEMLPPSFRVTLEDPARIDAFHRALCPSKRTGDCGKGIVVVRHPRR